MTLSDQDFDQILKLSHLAVASDSRDAFKANLEKICLHVEALSNLDLDGVEPASWASDKPTPKRLDVVSTSVPDFTETNAPKWEDGCFEVPSILGDV
ncbi:MAG: Asp-tRNA(Asn)/Glu-tRNA(Gln) amidotransferase subunit GatC [bacterium]|nr:Asp-tRNA(Asn)/Glu-tRNA(Gln) amidotransferase subunit GatC [bacterium]